MSYAVPSQARFQPKVAVMRGEKGKKVGGTCPMLSPSQARFQPKVAVMRGEKGQQAGGTFPMLSPRPEK